MKQLNKLNVLIAGLLFLVGPSALAEKPNAVHLILLSGQSNMANLDPARVFTPEVEKHFGPENVVVVKVAQVGQPIRRWYKKWKVTGDQNPDQIGDICKRLMEETQKAMSGKSIKSVTLIWMHGERDAKEGLSDQYEEAFFGILEQLKSDLRVKEVAYIIGRISDSGLGKEDWDKVRAIQQKLGETGPHSAWVNTDDHNDDKGTNNLHYSEAGYDLLAERYVEKVKELVKGPSLSLQAQTNVPKQEIEPKTPPPTISDVAYGQHQSQVLDFWKADANKPTPLMIYFHGGGFKKGSKRQISRDIHVNEYLKNGISCISAGYPFSEEMDIVSICKECEGVITFVRSKAKEWNVDPNRIGVSGCSAGAIIAFWIGTQKHEQVSVIGATQQPIGTVALLPYITPATPPCIIYQEAPERNQLHGPVNAQMIKDAYAKHGVECLVYGAGANKFDTPPDGKDKFSIMLEFYMRKWGLSGAGNEAH